MWHELVTAEMARHALGLSTVIRLLWLHAIGEPLGAIGTCCTRQAGYEP